MNTKGKPLSEEDFIKKHRADFRQRGFDEQMCCMAWYILHLEAYDIITYEKQDDLVITFQDGSKKLIQVKSSVEENAKITDSSEAFWSTIENWLEYNDTKDEKFSSSVKYCLHTDMEMDNSCVKAICKLKDGEWDIIDVKNELKNLKDDKGAGATVHKLLALSDVELRKFFMKIEVQSSFDALRKLYRTFLTKYNQPAKADKIVEEVLGRMLIHKMEAADNKVNWYYQIYDFTVRFKDILNKVGDDDLTPVDYETPHIMPNGYNNMVFAQQLDSIGIADINDPQDPKMLENYGYLLQCENSITYYYQIQLLNRESEENINNHAIEVWKIPFEKYERQAIRKGDKPDDIKECGADCFFEVMDRDIPYGKGRTIIAPLSKGWFLRLSNQTPPSIRWRKDWK